MQENDHATRKNHKKRHSTNTPLEEPIQPEQRIRIHRRTNKTSNHHLPTKKATQMIPYAKQTIEEDDVRVIARAIQDDYLTTGLATLDFERIFCTTLDAKYGIAVNNGTSALILACKALGIKKGDEVITTPISFIATCSAILACEATPVFADVNHQALIDPKSVEKKISKKTKAILSVDYAGMPCDAEALGKIAKKHKLKYIRDCCHSLGGFYKSQPNGKCQWCDITVFSFHAIKNITTGEGGMLTTNQKDLYEKIILLRNHGIKKKSNIEPWYYEQEELSYNYRITDFQCSLGKNQLEKLNYFIHVRKHIASWYDEAFDKLPITIIKEETGQQGAYHLYNILTKNKKTRKALYEYLHERGVKAQIHYIPIYWQPIYKKKGYKKGLCPKAEDYYQRTLTLPIHPTLTPYDQKTVINYVKNYYKWQKQNTK